MVVTMDSSSTGQGQTTSSREMSWTKLKPQIQQWRLGRVLFYSITPREFRFHLLFEEEIKKITKTTDA